MNKQEIINTVYSHLKTQGEPAHDTYGMCSYRTASGLKCAIGCLIPNDLYNISIETKRVSSLYKNGFLQRIFPGITEEDVEFLDKLQIIHDNFFDQLDSKIQNLCSEYNLEFPS